MYIYGNKYGNKSNIMYIQNMKKQIFNACMFYMRLANILVFTNIFGGSVIDV